MNKINAIARIALVGRNSYMADVYVAMLRRLERLPLVRTRLVARVAPQPSWSPGDSHPSWSPVGPRVPAFTSFDALLASDVSVDLVVFADGSVPQAPMIRQALARGWHVICAENFAADAAEDAALHELARSLGLTLTSGPPSGFYVERLNDLVPDWRHYRRQDVHIDWTRPAVDALGRDPRVLVEELAPPLLRLTLPLFGDAEPERVWVVRLTPPDKAPGPAVLVRFAGGALLTLRLEHAELERDEAGMFVMPELSRPVSPAQLLAEGFATQLGVAVDAIDGRGTPTRSASIETVRRLMAAAREAIRTGRSVGLV